MRIKAALMIIAIIYALAQVKYFGSEIVRVVCRNTKDYLLTGVGKMLTFNLKKEWFEKIKSMNLDEMAKHHALFARAVINGFLQAMNLELSGEVPLEVSIKNQRLWLESEVRE